VRKEVGRVQDTFAPNQLMAGAKVLEALSAEFELGEKEVFFFRKGRHAWPMGYLMKKAGIE
jgi:hypothetical protein